MVFVAAFRVNAEAETRAEQYANEGDNYFRARDYINAILAYKKSLALDSSRGLTYYGLALCYHQQQQWELAIEAWNQARTRLQPEGAMYLVMGADYFHLKRYKEAMQQFRSAADLVETNPKVLASVQYWIGSTYKELNQLKEAVAALKEAIRLNAEDPDFHFELGTAYQTLGRNAEAVGELREAIRLRPQFADAYYTLGLVYVAMNEREEALRLEQELAKFDDARAKELHLKIPVN